MSKVKRKHNFRPSWTDYFLALAFIASQRSHDAETKHGCVIVDKDNRILGIGYNGFPRGVDDTALPNIRPWKYDWIQNHSELNAVLNSNGKLDNAKAYITGHPCGGCLSMLWQAGVRQIFAYDKRGWLKEPTGKDSEFFNEFVKRTGIQVTFVLPENFDWVIERFTQLNEEISKLKAA